MLENGFIKLHRSILTWEWADDPITFRVFIHLLLTVNVCNSTWHGIDIPRGSRVSSIRHLADETHLSVQQIRTALKHLISTQEITQESHSQYSLFSVVNYDNFQGNQHSDQQTANKQLTSDQQTANNKGRKYKESNKNVKEIYPAPAEIFGDNNLPEDFVPDEGDYFANWGD